MKAKWVDINKRMSTIRLILTTISIILVVLNSKFGVIEKTFPMTIKHLAINNDEITEDVVKNENDLENSVSGIQPISTTEEYEAYLYSKSAHYSQGCSLEQAVALCPEDGVISIQKNLNKNQKIYIETGKTVTIDLNGYSVTNYTTDVFINKGKLTIKDSQNSGARIYGTEAGIRNNDEGTGTITIESGTVSGNTYGIYNAAGTLNVNGGKIVGNNIGIFSESGTIIVHNGTITGANTYGAGTQTTQRGIYIGKGNLYIYNGEIKGKKYGIYNKEGIITLYGGTITGTDDYGIHNDLQGSIIVNNVNKITGNSRLI